MGGSSEKSKSEYDFFIVKATWSSKFVPCQLTPKSFPSQFSGTQISSSQFNSSLTCYPSQVIPVSYRPHSVLTVPIVVGLLVTSSLSFYRPRRPVLWPVPKCHRPQDPPSNSYKSPGSNAPKCMAWSLCIRHLKQEMEQRTN